MGDFLIMSKKELKRKALFEAVKQRKMTLVECHERLGISYRQTGRSFKRYCIEGDKGLCHKSRGKTPQNAYSEKHKSVILNLYREKYIGFGPTLASEKMEEDDGIKVHDETLRLWLKKDGLWVRKRKHVVYRERRERRAQFGDLLQIDGSIHDWFLKDRHDCLLNMVDDATGITFALLDTGETTQILLTCLKKWIEKYGIPKSVYVDLKNVYIGSKHLQNRYEDNENDGFSIFQQVCKKLGIQIIKAYSPQAKGRVERKHQVFQDRFLKDLKLYGIKTIEAANEHLENKFLSQINKKFSQAPKDLTDAHRDSKIYGDLNEIICWQYQRQVKNDWSIRFKNEYFQLRELKEQKLLRPGQFITLKKYLNGDIKFWHGDFELRHAALSRKPIPPSKTKKYYIPKGIDPILQSATIKKNNQNSPWRKTNATLYRKNPTSIQQKSTT